MKETPMSKRVATRLIQGIGPNSDEYPSRRKRLRAVAKRAIIKLKKANGRN